MILLSQLISATNNLRSSSFLRLQHSEPYSKTVIKFHFGCHGDALFSPHFSKSPECCTCQTYSPFDIFFTPSILRYHLSVLPGSQIDKSCDLFQHNCSQSHLPFFMLFSYCHRFSAFISSLFSCCTYSEVTMS